MQIRVLTPSLENIRLAADAIREGNVVGMPTETVYGLAGDALNESALARIFSAKERPTFDPLIVHVYWRDAPSRYLEQLSKDGIVDLGPLSPIARERAEKLLQRFWPGPLTLVLPKSSRVPDLATSGLPNVAIRMPNHPVAQALIVASGTPLAAPSANRFGRISPTSAQDVAAELGDRIPLVLDGGPCGVGVESTVVAVGENGELALLRPGGVAAEEIENIAGVALIRGSARIGEKYLAPGQLASHYAPAKRLHLLPGTIETLPLESLKPLIVRARRIGLLALQGDSQKKAKHLESLTGTPVTCRVLSPTGDRAEAARKLFSELRALDESEADLLLAEPCTDQTGLGYAISDRLQRSAAEN